MRFGVFVESEKLFRSVLELWEQTDEEQKHDPNKTHTHTQTQTVNNSMFTLQADNGLEV